MNPLRDLWRRYGCKLLPHDRQFAYDEEGVITYVYCGRCLDLLEEVGGV